MISPNKKHLSKCSSFRGALTQTPEALAYFLKAEAGMQYFSFPVLGPHEKWELFLEIELPLGADGSYLVLKHCGEAGSLQMFARLWDLRLVAVMTTTSLRVLLSHFLQ